MEKISYGRFFEKYTLRYLRRHTHSEVLLQISIAVWQYGTEPLRTGHQEPSKAKIINVTPEAVRAAVYPRWRALLDKPAAITKPKLTSRSGNIWRQRIDRLQQTLEIAETALRAVATLAAIVSDWQLRRRQHQLLDTQRELLQAALAQNLAGADEAQRLAQEPDFVAGYLAEETNDPEDLDQTTED